MNGARVNINTLPKGSLFVSIATARLCCQTSGGHNSLTTVQNCQNSSKLQLKNKRFMEQRLRGEKFLVRKVRVRLSDIFTW